MAWSETLKDLIKVHLPKLKSLVNINVNICCNNTSEVVEYSPRLKKIDVNIRKLSLEEKEIFAKVLHDSREDGQILLENKSAELVRDFKVVDGSRGTQETLDFLKKLAPQEDIVIWRAALYIREKFIERKDISMLKSDLVSKYGEKGRNIANLCSAGYIEDLLKPNYDSLTENFEEEALLKAHRDRLYHLVVHELTITVFVHSKSLDDDIRSEIEGKIEQNVKYGIKFLNIHGIGSSNVGKIREIVGGIEETFKEEGRDLSNIVYKQEKSIIFVRLEF